MIVDTRSPADVGRSGSGGGQRAEERDACGMPDGGATAALRLAACYLRPATCGPELALLNQVFSSSTLHGTAGCSREH